ncbi:putative mitochondrial mitochondrial structure specific endonuclease I (SSE-1) [Leptomonas pyrrhocoris]|uniref:Putative mitochondrial mitochondrial structure specific endonuclease I (SSE-1) n=1 Tax=Leptomonas pyrrhocoris TaxID=157538 RepID=A0A0M9FXY0_LEPPY|nr:putative mitochondrial mitochondrial structure specific endonuclease I (SSE-1) [Leptomonas pyrrhocoris]XP_015656828.1 putative mitochondrial mitochondrial structure specific endonuclease I (SSE-1) [Leptomonas pyrrhocoris]XP_015656829.1 putative mitochondrial mitochondrial structure specific endonuclease I (SSE-1) [Leptomonas pyrrhocoris]XP_015656830.1 putative mitochondrial mitochondrial structure specific endonuclease I (SSE-1) [Leptomonas pyrrhocoris]KPA78388.1 putative mitochondrial mitoc|eukprot:XP_015656827.1 putative mitochondrial mitochondrial structure specific endonuclease I (SSE-1) [Leptomonas pyrrhocoris]
MSVREKAVVLIDGPAVVHRWYHRWSYTTEKYGSEIDPKKFAFKNARFIIATAHSFDPTHLAQHLLSPQLEYAHTPKLNKIIICFDQGDGGRRQIFREYKANRAEVKRTPELLMMEKVAKRVFEEEPPHTALVVPDFDARLKTVNAEADDMIATLALYNQQNMTPTVVMSHDFDLYQLVDDLHKSYNFDIRTKHLVSEKNVIERVGVHPRLIRDFKAMAGDASDNIPGMKGIGKVRARQLLKKYGDLDGILSRGLKNETGHLSEVLAQGAKSALISRQLVDFRMCPKVLKACEAFLKRK